MTYEAALARVGEKLTDRLYRCAQRIEHEDFSATELAYERGFRAATKLAIEDVETLQKVAGT